MKNKKGFTLVELLAVIVILAIILVIAIPQIAKVIDDGKINSLKDSAMLIAKNAEREYLVQKTTNKDFNPNNMNCNDFATLTSDYGECYISFDSNGIATIELFGAPNS